MTSEVRTSDGEPLPPHGLQLARKSCVAYLRPVLVAATVVAFLLGAPPSQMSDAVRAALVLLVIAWAAFRVAETRSVTLFLDADGVWVYAGILPWARGVVGLRYRDLDDPVMMQSLSSWALRSHTIVLRSRFSNRDAIEVDHMSDAPAALERIFRAQRDAERHGPPTTFGS